MPFPPVCATLCQKDPVSCQAKGWNIHMQVNISKSIYVNIVCISLFQTSWHVYIAHSWAALQGW